MLAVNPTYTSLTSKIYFKSLQLEPTVALTSFGREKTISNSTTIPPHYLIDSMTYPEKVGKEPRVNLTKNDSLGLASPHTIKLKLLKKDN